MNALVSVEAALQKRSWTGRSDSRRTRTRGGSACGDRAPKTVRAEAAGGDRSAFEQAAREISWQQSIVARSARELDRLDIELRNAADVRLKAQLEKLFKEHDRAFEKCISAFVTALDVWFDLQAVRAQLEAEGFAADLRVLPLLPQINGNPFLAADLIEVALQTAARRNPRLTRIVICLPRRVTSFNSSSGRSRPSRRPKWARVAWTKRSDQTRQWRGRQPLNPWLAFLRL